MATYTVTITNEETDALVYRQVNVDPANVGTNGEQHRDELTGEPLTEMEKVLLVVAPEVCPFDCDHCRS